MLNINFFFIINYKLNAFIQSTGNLIFCINRLTTSKYAFILFLAILFYTRSNVFTVVLLLLFYQHPLRMFYSFNTSSFNIGLNNALSASHPLIVLIALLWVYDVVFFSFAGLSQQSHRKVHYTVAGLSTLSVLLGSLWSDQEVFWDGFWNWDYIEIGLVMLVYASWVTSHKYKQKKNIWNLCALVLILVKFGSITPFLKSIHSFSGAPLMYFAPANSLLYIIGVVYFTHFVLSRVVWIQIFVMCFVIANYALLVEQANTLYFTRTLLFSSVILYVLIWINRLQRLGVRLISVTLIRSFQFIWHLGSVWILYCYWSYFNYTIFPIPNYKKTAEIKNFHSFGGYLSSFVMELADTYNIYFKKSQISFFSVTEPASILSNAFIK